MVLGAVDVALTRAPVECPHARGRRWREAPSKRVVEEEVHHVALGDEGVLEQGSSTVQELRQLLQEVEAINGGEPITYFEVTSVAATHAFISESAMSSSTAGTESASPLPIRPIAIWTSWRSEVLERCR